VEKILSNEHGPKVGKDAEVILFSPQYEHGKVIEHLREKPGG
jgi:hypothetical protein